MLKNRNLLSKNLVSESFRFKSSKQEIVSLEYFSFYYKFSKLEKWVFVKRDKFFLVGLFTDEVHTAIVVIYLERNGAYEIRITSRKFI
ncbi:hypothetical protein CH380_05240 [Leptospira adleri]|uniref:Uncharacterized protein n=1 Tax=Leptospira adleri TaxID=2023186 RepID=A0A2M9YSE7_9LEPT|nr:hypothetical protein CH380_05240 [Leptospira adleri]PJZ61186.1 hypothetical protein CH376_14715 [Leptospira adleri]